MKDLKFDPTLSGGHTFIIKKGTEVKLINKLDDLLPVIEYKNKMFYIDPEWILPATKVVKALYGF